MSASPHGYVVLLAFWTAAFRAVLFVAADASKEVQQIRSSVEKLHALKQLLNAEQVILLLPLLYYVTDIVHRRAQCTGCANKKNNPLGKINYLSYVTDFLHQIYSFYRGEFAPHMQQISSQYLLRFKNYNHLNLKV